MPSELNPFDNCFQPAFSARGSTVNKWGKDSTGLIEYRFNNQGFRSDIDYNWVPEFAFFGNSSVFGVGVDQNQTLTTYFPKSHNYGISGIYLNWHNVVNLENYVNSPFYNHQVKIVFFWIDRVTENIDEMIQYVNTLAPEILHISSGSKKENAINLMPHIDRDVSQTHPGPKTHRLWARTVDLLLKKNARKINHS